MSDNVDYLKNEASYIKRITRNIKELRKQHRERLLDTMVQLPRDSKDAAKLADILMETNE